MEINSELIEEAKEIIKGKEFVCVNTFKLEFHKKFHKGIGIVTCNLLLEHLTEIGVIEESNTKIGYYKVLI